VVGEHVRQAFASLLQTCCLCMFFYKDVLNAEGIEYKKATGRNPGGQAALKNRMRTTA